ncbi:MAG TPA: hypothetical protein VK203_16275 [Nostocaceae cyanobacterium]|nr:hypothetical protein [Nostocaceae cyanobacterium]
MNNISKALILALVFAAPLAISTPARQAQAATPITKTAPAKNTNSAPNLHSGKNQTVATKPSIVKKVHKTHRTHSHRNRTK